MSGSMRRNLHAPISSSAYSTVPYHILNRPNCSQCREPRSCTNAQQHNNASGCAIWWTRRRSTTHLPSPENAKPDEGMRTLSAGNMLAGMVGMRLRHTRDSFQCTTYNLLTQTHTLIDTSPNPCGGLESHRPPTLPVQNAPRAQASCIQCPGCNARPCHVCTPRHFVLTLVAVLDFVALSSDTAGAVHTVSFPWSPEAGRAHKPPTQIGLAISTIDENACTPYTASTPALPPGVKSLGGGRLVSTRRHHLRPAGGCGSGADTAKAWALKAA